MKGAHDVDLKWQHHLVSSKLHLRDGARPKNGAMRLIGLDQFWLKGGYSKIISIRH